MRRLAIPVLYASFIGTSTEHGCVSVHLFQRTLSYQHPSLGVRFPFRKYVRYIESRMAGYRGKSFMDDITSVEGPDTDKIAIDYFTYPEITTRKARD